MGYSKTLAEERNEEIRSSRKEMNINMRKKKY
jgi:hypothetical protein